MGQPSLNNKLAASQISLSTRTLEIYNNASILERVNLGLLYIECPPSSPCPSK